MEFFELQDQMMSRELNLEKIFKLSSQDKAIVMSLFNELMDCFYGDKGMNFPDGIKVDFIRANVIYNTLINNDYLVTKRESNLDKVLS